MAYLRNIHTGEIYPMNEHLMRRGDFEPVETLETPVEVPEAPVAEKPRAAPKPRKKKAVEVPEAPEAPEAPDLDFDDELLADMDDVE